MENSDGGRDWGGWQLDQGRKETGPCGESPKENQGPPETSWGKVITETLGGVGEVLGLVRCTSSLQVQSGHLIKKKGAPFSSQIGNKTSVTP